MSSKILLKGTEIRVESRELIVQGDLKRLPWRAFDVLLALVERPGEVVTKEDLLRKVWGGEAIDGSNLTQAVAQIRKAMGEVSPGNSYVETVPRIGYRIAGNAVSAAPAIERTEPEIAVTAPPATRRPGWATLVLIAALVLALTLTVVRFAFRDKARSESPASEITETPFTAFEGDELSGSFSPDGREVAFAWAKTGHLADIYLKSVDSETLRPFVISGADEKGPVFSPDGLSIAFLRIGAHASTIVIKPRDGGAERLITIISNPHPAFVGSPGPYLAWTKDGKGLIYASDKSLHLWRLDTSSSVQLTRAPEKSVLGDADPALSPDGGTLLFARIGGFGSAALYRLPLNRNYEPAGPATLVFANGAWNRSPVWHPNGRKVVFTSGQWAHQRLWYLDIQRPWEAKPIPNAGADGQQAAISPKGDQILYTRWFYRLQIWSAALAGAGRNSGQPLQPLFTSTRQDNLPTISRDGSLIAMESDRSGSSEIWTARSDGSDLRKITERGGEPSGSPDISPDGKDIVFDGLIDGQRDIFMCDVTGKNLHRLTEDPADDVLPRWSSDGRSIYFASYREGASQIWRMDVATRKAVRVTQDGGFVAQESPDGKTLFFTRKGEAATTVFAMPVSGGPARKVVDEIRNRAMAVTREGLYFIPAQARSDLRYLDFALGKEKVVLTAPNLVFDYVAVDKRNQLATLVILGAPPGDLMLVRGFRFD